MGQIRDGFEHKTGTPGILARKHDGPYRVYIVYLKLNQLTKKDDITLPRINDVLEALGEDECFSLA